MSRRRLTWDIIFDRCTTKHKGLYTYNIEDQDEYINAHMQMKIGCKKHGLVSMTVNSHLHVGGGCRFCRDETNWDGRRSSWEEILPECERLHDGKYKYYIDEQREYKTNKTLIIAHCDLHGEFEISVTDHKNNLHGCRECGIIKGSRNHAWGWGKVINECIKKHKNRYTYYLDEQSEYIDIHTKMICHCDDHGMFELSADSHKRGTGCKQCGIEKAAKNKRLGWNVVIEQCTERHNNLYSYDLSKQCEYKNLYTNIIVYCDKHGDFTTTVKSHKNLVTGCPKCSNSYNVLIIRDYLLDQKIDFIQEHHYKDCLGDSKRLKFDFYVPKFDLLIEFDGRQHFEYIPNHFHKKGYWQFERQQRYDEIKNVYAKENEIPLLRISYMENTLSVLSDYMAKFL